MSLRLAATTFTLISSLTAACGNSSTDATPTPASPAVQALGVSAYDSFSDAPLGVLLLDATGEIQGEAVRTGEGDALAFHLQDATGRTLDLSLAATGSSLLIDGQPATLDPTDAGLSLLRTVVLDPAFHSLGETAATGSTALETAESALAIGGGGTGLTGKQRCYSGCSDDYVDCTFGGYPEVCDDVYDACIRLCDYAYPARSRSRFAQ